MNQFDRNLTTFEIDLLFNHFDKNENGALELRELVASLDDDSILGEFHVELLNYMNRNRMDFNDVFRRFSEENFIVRENFIKFGLEIGNGRFPETKLSQLFSELDQDRNYKLDIDEMEYLFSSDDSEVPI